MTPQEFDSLSQRYLRCVAEGDWASALRLGQQALVGMPGHAQVLSSVALCQMRLMQLDEALVSYREAQARMPEDANVWDGLAELHGLRMLRAKQSGDSLDVVERERRAAREAGCKALALKDDGVDRAPVGAVAPTASQCAGLCVISYSLFGDNPRYCETMLLNAHLAPQLFPNWQVRVYCDGSVPLAVRERLGQAGAELVVCEGERWKDVHPLMWRFAVMNDARVGRWLLRDADSLLTTREQSAVHAWLASDKCFHVMRDYFTHTELLMAGLMGGCVPVCDDVLGAARQYVQTYTGEMRVVDQHFLRQQAWPTVRQSLLTHDSWFGFLDAQIFPAHLPHGLGDVFHVGCNWATSAIGADGVSSSDGKVSWCLLDAAGAEVCRYEARVTQGAWRTNLPMSYIQRIQNGEWRVVVSG